MTDANKPGFRHKGLLLVVIGICIGIAVMLSGDVAVQKTSSDKFCDASCHSHPDATQTWIRSPHYSNKSGVVTHCVDCHLPPPGGMDYYIQKARLGSIDIYGKLFKDPSKINWLGMQTLIQARSFTWDSSCVRCHVNLFPSGLEKKGVDAHLHYQRSTDKMRCINCHLHVGHFRGKESGASEDEGEVHEDLDKTFLSSPQGFQSYTEVVPGSNVKIRMVAVPGGTFEMGSPESEPYRHADEGPVRKVTLSPFYMERNEVTWREYEVYLMQRGNKGRERDLPAGARADGISGPTPAYGSPDQGWGRGTRPAITMTYHAATMYCEWLSQVTGKKYRLPTEAEWEYAARAGTETPYFFQGNPSSFTTHRWLNHIFGVKTEPISDFAWYMGDSLDQTHPTATTKANEWGLEDMLGNVREFCLDWYDPNAYAQMGDGVKDPRGPSFGKEHVVRGGSYLSDAADLRCAARDHTREEEWLLTDPQSPKSIWWYSDCTDVGFRVVREADDVAAPVAGSEPGASAPNR